MKRLPIHPLAELLPRMTPAEFSALKADVADSEGLREPVVLLDGKILDGRHRADACYELKIEPKTIDFKPGWGSPVRYIYSKAIHRNLTDSQKAAAAVGIEDELGKEAARRSAANLKQNGNAGDAPRGGNPSTSERREGRTRAQWAASLNVMGRPRLEAEFRRRLFSGRTVTEGMFRDLSHSDMRRAILDRLFGPEQPTPAPAPNGKSRELAGGLFGVSGRYVSEAKLIRQQDAKLFAEVLAGHLTLPRAKRQIRLAHKRAVLAERAPLAAGARTGWRVITGDCRTEMESLARHTFRLAFMDPPYNLGIDYGDGPDADRLPDEKYVEQWEEVARYIADELLTPDGSLWFLICDEYADLIGVALRRVGLKRCNWIKWYETFGVNCRWRFNRTSRHLFYCVKDLDRRVFDEGAVNRKSDRQVKYGDMRAHPGGKTWDDVWGVNPPIPRVVGNHTDRLPDFKTQLPVELLLPIIGCATEPGDLVLDPTAGSGTTGVAAMQLGRRSTLIEKNPARAKQMEARLVGLAAKPEGKAGGTQ